MLKFLVHVAVISLIILGVYIVMPESGIVEIKSEDIYFESSVVVFSVLLVFISFILLFVVSFIFWILRLPGSVRSAVDGYRYKKKIEKMLDILYLVDINKIKEARKKYRDKDFESMDHPMLESLQRKLDTDHEKDK